LKLVTQIILVCSNQNVEFDGMLVNLVARTSSATLS
jgi:hypothetical protein